MCYDFRKAMYLKNIVFLVLLLCHRHCLIPMLSNVALCQWCLFGISIKLLALNPSPLEPAQLFDPGQQIISNSAGRPGQQIVDFYSIMDTALRGFSEQIRGLLQNDQQDEARPILPKTNPKHEPFLGSFFGKFWSVWSLLDIFA